MSPPVGVLLRDVEPSGGMFSLLLSSFISSDVDRRTRFDSGVGSGEGNERRVLRGVALRDEHGGGEGTRPWERRRFPRSCWGIVKRIETRRRAPNSTMWSNAG